MSTATASSPKTRANLSGMPAVSARARKSARYDALPPSLAPRGLTREFAAAFVGLSQAAFDKARSDEKYPGPTLPGGRYDLILLQVAMNRLSGILTESEATAPLDGWRARHNAGSA